MFAPLLDKSSGSIVSLFLKAFCGTSRTVSDFRIKRKSLDMRGETWNHNIHYHGIVLRSLPSPCRQVLDVGCGQGLLARKLAQCCDEVFAIDADHEALARAEADAGGEPRIRFIEGDVMTHPFAQASFDAITVVATLHHLPLKLALLRFRWLLRPGGVLAVVGSIAGRRSRTTLSQPRQFP